MIASNIEVDFLRRSLGVDTNDQVKESLELFREAVPILVFELLALLDNWEDAYYEMVRHWTRDEEKSSIIEKYVKSIPGLDEESDEKMFDCAMEDKSFVEGLFFDYLLTCTDTIPIGDQTFNLIEQIAASESIAKFHGGLLAKGYTADRCASEMLFHAFIKHDYTFREQEFGRWRTRHKKTMKTRNQALQKGKKKLISVKDGAIIIPWTEAAEVFEKGLEVAQKIVGKLEVYEKMINEDLTTMGNLLGVADLDPFLQVPIKDREKVFSRCNRFQLHKLGEPEPSEE